VFETRLVVEQSYATPQAVVKYNIDWCSNGVAVVRAFKEESGESKLAFQSQRVPPRESRRQEGIESDSRVDFNVESGRIAYSNKYTQTSCLSKHYGQWQSHR
jgi:hypothetical protein